MRSSKNQLSISAALVIVAIFFGITTECTAQFDANLVVVGVSKEKFISIMTEKGIYKPSRYENDNSRYVHTTDVRINKQMEMTRYDYYFKNDTCYTIKITPSSSINLIEEIPKKYEWVKDVSKPEQGRLIHKYVPSDRSYQVWLIEEKRYNQVYYLLQIFPN